MKKIMLVMPALLLLNSCQAQTKEKNSSPESKQPKVSIDVKRETDERGNVIRYDSTYTWSYSSDGTQSDVSVDSVMAAFRKQFDSAFPDFFRNSFGNPVWGDSMFHRDFLRPDYFKRKWETDFFNMEQMMRSMDSLRNSFLRDKYPGIADSSLNWHKM